LTGKPGPVNTTETSIKPTGFRSLAHLCILPRDCEPKQRELKTWNTWNTPSALQAKNRPYKSSLAICAIAIIRYDRDALKQNLAGTKTAGRSFGAENRTDAASI
jgi:hypothetical protein